MSENLFLLVAYVAGGLLVLSVLAAVASWLAEHPQAWVTRKLENIFRSFGDK